VQATTFIEEHFLRMLEPRMPRGLPVTFSDIAGSCYASAVRTALTETFETLNRQYCESHKQAGSTCTVALFTGALVTVANVGDSEAVLDSFTETVPMTVCSNPRTPHFTTRIRTQSTGTHACPLSPRPLRVLTAHCSSSF
jgi:serine/threonine protein phosphatase PrpC